MKKTVFTLTLAATMLFSAVPTLAFDDVSDSHWAKTQIDNTVALGLFSGIGNNLFAPEKEITKAEFITVVMRAIAPENITDIQEPYWWSGAAEGAIDIGIIQSTDFNSISKETMSSSMSREEMAYVLANALNIQDKELVPNIDPSNIPDFETVDANYQDEVLVAYSNHILSGIDDLGTFNPTGKLTRAQGATVLMRLVDEPVLAETDFAETDSTETGFTVTDKIVSYLGKDYEIIYVDGGDRTGTRENNVAVDIGFDDREYWGLTNEYGQLVYVLAEEIKLQNDDTEPVNGNGRYYNDEANVPGTEQKDLDQGHIIADSLGGVSNAYNITPQNYILNRYGDQAYMEKAIRDAGGCTNFIATITYPDTSTQIPSHYKYEYVLLGNAIVDEFDNVNPDEYNEDMGIYDQETETADTNDENQTTNDPGFTESQISAIDTNNNGTVTISEAKAAGYVMPITSDHWLYKYMIDSDKDGIVGES